MMTQLAPVNTLSWQICNQTPLKSLFDDTLKFVNTGSYVRVL